MYCNHSEDGQIANGNFQTTKDLDTTVDLVYSLEKQYNIDKTRIYNTGQSMSARASIAMDIKYPYLFAATLFF